MQLWLCCLPCPPLSKEAAVADRRGIVGTVAAADIAVGNWAAMPEDKDFRRNFALAAESRETERRKADWERAEA